MEVVGRKDRYQLPAEHHAEGGQARVFRATDSRGTIVAVKVAREKGERGMWMDRERTEIQRLLSEYPNLSSWLVNILDDGVTGEGRRFVVMDWFDQSLAEWIVGRPLLERLSALEKACEAVTRLHRSDSDVRQGVVHRDIKPPNFLITGKGEQLRVVLSDFGGAKRAHLGAASTNSGMHTEGFAPPDQVLPRKIPPDRSWDVYALAVTIYWCLTGQIPGSAMQASRMFTAEGWQLFQIQASTNLPASTRARLEALGQRPISELIRIDEIKPLSALDQENLQFSLAAMLSGISANPEADALDLTEELVDELIEALQPDPMCRTPDARRLQSLMRVLGKKIRRLQQQRIRRMPQPIADSVRLSGPAPPRPPKPTPQPAPTPRPPQPAPRSPVAETIDARQFTPPVLPPPRMNTEEAPPTPLPKSLPLSTEAPVPPPPRSFVRPLLAIALSLAAIGMWLGNLSGGSPVSNAINSTMSTPFSSGMARRHRAEVPANIDGIKTAELAYDAAFDRFIEQNGPYPRPINALNSQDVPWSSGSNFDTLGWSPDGNVRGSYSIVTLSPTDFVVHGWIDADNDGVPAHYTATKSINAMQVTGSDVY